MADTPDILKRILRTKAEEIVAAAEQTSLAEMARQAEAQAPPRGFRQALAEKVSEGAPAVIAEIKRASPSKGVMRDPYHPGEIDAQLVEFAGLASHLGMDALIEVHDREELERAIALDAPLIGIKNRDLRTFDTTLETTLSLRAHVDAQRLLVTESGIHTRDDVRRMREHGVNAFLVGEAFMRAADPGARLAELFNSPGSR